MSKLYPPLWNCPFHTFRPLLISPIYLESISQIWKFWLSDNDDPQWLSWFVRYKNLGSLKAKNEFSAGIYVWECLFCSEDLPKTPLLYWKNQEHLTLLEPRAHFGDIPVKIPSSLSPKRDCGPKRVNTPCFPNDAWSRNRHRKAFSRNRKPDRRCYSKHNFPVFFCRFAPGNREPVQPISSSNASKTLQTTFAIHWVTPCGVITITSKCVFDSVRKLLRVFEMDCRAYRCWSAGIG